MTTSRQRLLLFGVLVALCALAAIIYVAFAAGRADRVNSEPPLPGTRSASEVAALGDTPRIVFRSTRPDANYSRLAAVPLNAVDGPPIVSDLECARVDVADGVGMCLESEFGLLDPYHAVRFDDQLREVWRVPLKGLPSRVRIAPDGSLAAITVFVAGHSYMDAGFSTLTTLVDLETRKTLGDLEQFEVTRDGRSFKEVDFNFWGVTFRDDSRTFYATLASGGNTYLVQGDAMTKTARVLHDNVECPSLSPDGTRIAYKKRVSGPGLVRWRFHVLDLETMTETPLAEARSIDDQVEWLDDERIIYSTASDDDPASPDTWVVPADGSGKPALYREATDSAVVVATP
jgi:hypothetical protein